MEMDKLLIAACICVPLLVPAAMTASQMWSWNEYGHIVTVDEKPVKVLVLPDRRVRYTDTYNHRVTLESGADGGPVATYRVPTGMRPGGGCMLPFVRPLDPFERELWDKASHVWKVG